MTNGEKIKEIFPNLEWIFNAESEYYKTYIDGIHRHCFDSDWWFSEYEEPTNKNCRTCRNFGSHHGICEICKDNKCWTEIEPTTKNDVPENNAENIYICSCGYGWDKSKVVRHHFCPNCGKAVEPATKKNLAVGKDNNVTSKEDAISRQEAIDTIRQLYLDLASQKAVIDILKVLPSVTPQLRKGHWISTETKGVRYAFWCRYKCSLCGELSDYKNFCPNCGAKMESEEIRNDK